MSLAPFRPPDARPRAPRATLHYRPEIDGLRAVAVLPVIFFHAGFSVFSGGFVGVDVFFVLSGYLITRILLNDLAQGRLSLLRFYERRARRILPALFCVMLCCLPFAWVWMQPRQLADFAQSLMATVFFASNILFWREAGYFETAAEEKPLLHTWSLAVEEQYYLFFPLLLLAMWRFGRGPAFWAIVLLGGASLALSEWGARHAPVSAFYLAPTRAWELLAGSLCAFVTTGPHPSKGNGGLAGLGLGLIVMAILVYDETVPFPSAYTLAPVIGTALVLLFGQAGTRVARLLSRPVFVGIGLISYSAYLWHQPLFAFARLRSLGPPDDALMLGLALAALGLAWISWRYVEQPFRNGAACLLPRPRALFLAAGASAAVFLGFGAAGHLSQGFPDRLTPLQQAYLSSATPSPLRDRCHTFAHKGPAPEEACTYFAPQAQVAVFGDSHTVELAYALGEALAPYGIGIRHLSHSACPPALETQDFGPSCAGWTRQALTHLRQNAEISHVIVSYRIAAYFDPETHSASQRRQMKEDLKTILAHISETKKAIFVMQVPELAAHVHKHVSLTPQPQRGDLVTLPAQDWQAVRATLEKKLGLREGPFRYFDPTPSFCDATSCFAGKAATAFYFDDDHMSISGARLFAQKLADMVLGDMQLAGH
jgi:peptidoglycan/LPS O-acetylase OafA/YrhL